MMYKFLASFIAISVDEMLESGKTIGTSSNQVILGFLVVSLILVVVYREWQQVRTNRKAEARHELTITKHDEQHQDLIDRLDRERTGWEEERRNRISMLMTLVQDNTKAMEHAASAQSTVAEAVGVNSSAVTALRDLIYDMKAKRR